MRRRDFLKVAGVVGAGIAAGGSAEAAPAANGRVSKLEQPAAIAMWDFSWLLRHYPTGEFENWDAVLDGLVERGYDAIRMDCFPHLVAAPEESFAFPKGDWNPVMWGNQYSTTVNPRAALLEFLPKCRERGVKVGLSTWFFGPGAEKVEGLDGFVRVWDDTLTFLNERGLLEDSFYVDLLNEYPMFNGFSWLSKELESKKEGAPAEEIPEREAFQWMQSQSSYNVHQRKFYREFMTSALGRLKERWPNLDFMACQTAVDDVPWQNMDPSQYDVLDVHFWFVMNPLLPQDTGYWENIHSLAKNDNAFPSVNEKVLQNWRAHRDELTAWMDAKMAEVAEAGRRLGVPYGNTEGWGTINWLDHPALTWDVIQDAGLICAELGAKHGYWFNCSSNFTHPQFGRLWRDVGWHREVTGRVRGGELGKG